MRGPLRPRTLLAAALLAALPLLVPAQGRSNLPTLGDAGEMSVMAERRLGESIAREIYRDPDYVEDPLLQEYLELIWQPLLAAARERGELSPELQERFAWQPMLIRDRTINAFALPGGYMGVHLGLIGLSGSRDELASVLAHELSHVTQRHISRLMSQQSRQAPWLMAAMILGALAIRKSPDAAGAAITGSQAVAAQTQLNFSRDMEREADRVGYGVMTQAGFDGQGFVGLFEKLQQANRLNDNGNFPYLRSHPLTTERISDAQLRLQSQRLGAAGTAAPVNALPPASERADAMLAARARVLSEPGIDVLRLWMAEPQASHFEAQPEARRVGALYAAALAASRQREPALAQQHWARLNALAGTDTQARRLCRLLAVELAQNRGDPASALQQARDWPLSDTGGTPARPELLLLAQLQIQGGAAAEASASLQTRVAQHPQDAAAWTLLAAAWAAQGLGVRAARADAEARVAWMDYAGAADRLRAAQDLMRRVPMGRAAGAGATNDFIDASIVDTRLREVQSLLREQTLQR